MAVGKNKRVSKNKKGSKKKLIDPFTRKEWYNLKAPSNFHTRHFGQTLVTKTTGTKLATDSLKGRVYEMSLADLNADEDQAYRKIKLSCEDVQGRNCLTDFNGCGITRDKLCSLIRKNFSMIEGFTDVKTLDGYYLRMFCVGYTKRRPGQLKSTCYLRTSKIKLIHKKMVSIMEEEASNSTLKDLVKKIIPESIGKEIEKSCKKIFPLQNVLIRKIKLIKKPKFDLLKLMELYNYNYMDNPTEKNSFNALTEGTETSNVMTSELQ